MDDDSRRFTHYIFPSDPDVIFIGLHEWSQQPGNDTPLLSTYLCNVTEVDDLFNELEADLKRARVKAKAAIRKLNQHR